VSKREMLNSFADNVLDSVGAHRRPGAILSAAPDLQADKVGRERSRDAYTIDIDRIVPDPDQPRKEFEPEALERLAESLRTRGQLQPIQVRWDAAADRYVVIMGERRWRAAQVAGLKALSCVVRDGSLGDGEKLSIQLVENCLREDLKPIEQAHAFRALMDREGWSHERLAEELAVSQGTVTRALSLLKLPKAVQDRVEQGGLSPSHAHEIAKLDDPREQVLLAEAAAEQGLTRDDVAKQVRRAAPSKRKTPAKVQSTAVYRLGGYRIEVSRKSGIESESLCAALAEVIAKHQPGLRAAEEAA
jgi:ParB family chromosome partitioning protein